MFELQRATLDARTRTGDNSIGTRINAGRVQVVRVSFPTEKRGGSVVEPLSQYLPHAAAVAFLNALQ